MTAATCPGAGDIGRRSAAGANRRWTSSRGANAAMFLRYLLRFAVTSKKQGIGNDFVMDA